MSCFCRLRPLGAHRAAVDVGVHCAGTLPHVMSDVSSMRSSHSLLQPGLACVRWQPGAIGVSLAGTCRSLVEAQTMLRRPGTLHSFTRLSAFMWRSPPA